MNHPSLTIQNLQGKFKFLCKTLIVLFLSVLLLAPTSALALDYKTDIQSYVSNVKVELDSVLTSIKKLPNQSYDNGKLTLAEVDSKLHNIQSNAGKNAVYFQKLSDDAQTKSNDIVSELNKQYPEQASLQEALKGWNYRYRPMPPYLYAYRDRLDAVNHNIEELQSKRQRFDQVIVLSNKISKLSDNLEKRVSLAKQKAGNVKDYADALQSFSDPEIKSETSELDQFIADLTNNFISAS
ncbi:hypothetical protein HCG51_07180 [Tolypothrix sp. PCC 7910]|uniref:hypothetical protein n=1 Tax=Tolypothrix sp. PCC 7910 TaxID=2099387 RepID=UPI0014278256|nr:hypothetical protein [Tolypothrix sp. PCC 7910]QIR36555.1 hypothetical protein HCG51_07180 [Tolypothrix sp. PCC 7910]